MPPRGIRHALFWLPGLRHGRMACAGRESVTGSVARACLAQSLARLATSDRAGSPSILMVRAIAQSGRLPLLWGQST